MKLIVALVFCFPMVLHAEEFRVPSQVATLQQAVDQAVNGDTIIWEGIDEEAPAQQVRILDKNLTLKGSNMEPQAYPILNNSRFTPFSVEVAGSSKVNIQRIVFKGGSKAISLVQVNGQRPTLNLFRVTVTEAVRGLFGTAEEITVESTGFNRNEGNGLILTGVKKLRFQSVGFSSNLNYGLVVMGLPGEISDLQMNFVGAGSNGQGGIWLHNLHGSIDLNQINTSSNHGFNMQVTDSSHLSLRNGTFNDAQPDDFEGSADGLRISNSKISLLNININENQGKALFALGCANENPLIDLFQVHTVRSINGQAWVSGQKGACVDDPRWNWLEANAASDRIMQEGFESEDSQNNYCIDPKTSEQVQCHATREDRDSNGFGVPPF